MVYTRVYSLHVRMLHDRQSATVQHCMHMQIVFYMCMLCGSRDQFFYKISSSLGVWVWPQCLKLNEDYNIIIDIP